MTAATNAAGFKPGDHIVYPAHGVGRVTGIEKQMVAGHKLEVFVISFEQDKMTLRVPTAKAKSCGMRALASSKILEDALKTLTGRARIKRTMWSRRAQEYEAKINSGDLISIAEVVRDLHRASDQPEQSYSERQLYESALDRMARELAAVEKIDRDKAMEKLSVSLAAKRARAEAVAAAAASSAAA
jgi:CarD family transcriptional regulator